MKKEDLFETINDIDEKYVKISDTYKPKKKSTVWLKWVVTAACLCLVVSGVFAMVQINKNNTMTGSSTMTGDPIKLAGESNSNQDESNNISGAAHTENAAEEETENSFEKDNSNADELKDYSAIETLLNDSCAFAKVKVLEANSASVRSYIYTSYRMELIEMMYGKIDENIITVNMPGGTVGDAETIVSDNTEKNTNQFLVTGDEVYLFIMPESDDAYAVVGEYCGAILVKNGNVFFNKDIVSFQKESATNKLADMSESEFVELMTEMINNKN